MMRSFQFPENPEYIRGERHYRRNLVKIAGSGD
jgi:hypothetical protein